MTPGGSVRVWLLDNNVLFVRRVTAALTSEGLQVVCYTDPSHALTALEWNMPELILCATEFRVMGAFEMVALLQADAKTANIPVIALGNGSEKGQFEAFRAGCDDYIDRRRNPAEVAAHIRSFLNSAQHGFQATQLLAASETSFSGSLEHLDLPGIVQMLEHEGKTGALHVNSGETDAIIFFDEGRMKHAECARLAGDEAIIRIIKDCHLTRSGVYKFVPNSTAPESTVRRGVTDLLMDAMREFDEAQNAEAEREIS
jgi:CheY-like chemotaxis protein